MVDHPPYVPPSEQELDSLIPEFINMIRLGLSKDRRPGDGDLWADVYGLLDPIESASPEVAANELGKRLIDRVIAYGVVGSALVLQLAEAQGIEPSEVLDKLEASLVRDDDPGSGRYFP